MAITKTETLAKIDIVADGTKSIHAVYQIAFVDDSTDPNQSGHTTREAHYVADDTIPSSENKLVKDLAAVLFA